MNKKFSTLLATALVAGGLGSSAFATDFPTDQYVQLKVNGQCVIVGESSVRDSLALSDVNYLNPSSIEDVNKSLWKFTVKEVKDENGLIKGREVYLVNKVNGAVALTKEGASDKSAYYAPGAVVSASSLLLKNFTYNANTKKVSSSTDVVDFCGKAAYDATTKTVRKYVLGKVGTAIKLFVISEDASKIKTTSELERLISQVESKTLNISGVTILGDVIATSISTSSIDLSAELLNGVGNKGFNLVFNKDITSGAKFTNPFSENTLTADVTPVYTSASYTGISGYENALKAYKTGPSAIEAGIAAQKAAAQAYVKEVKVALAETVSTGGLLILVAPNSLEITAANNEFTETYFDNTTDAYKAVEKLKGVVTKEWTYDPEKGGKVADADKKAKELTDALAEVEKQLDAVKKQVSEAVANYDKAVKEFVKGAYRYEGETIDYAAYKIKVGDDEVNADVALNNAAALLGTTEKAIVDALKTNCPVAVESKVKTFTGYLPMAVVGKADTYVTVDTNYVAASEKYLSLGTMKLNKLVIATSSVTYGDNSYVANQVVLASDAYQSNGKLKTGLKEILVPEYGKPVTSAFFKMSIDLRNTGADKITILGNAPKIKNESGNPKYYNLYKDDTNDTNWELGKQIVIRTLGTIREASIMLPNEKPDVKNNTTITFAQPTLASKINDGDIYFIINKNVADEKNYGKYVVSEPEARVYSYAKYAYANVPATQWVVEKNNDSYIMKNRDFKPSFISDGKIFAVDEDNMIFTTTECDTFQLVKVDAVKEGHLGYKYVSEEVQQISDYVLSAVNYANMETPYYLAFDGNKDSLLTATSDKEKALTLVPMMDKDNKEVTSAYEMNDENLSKQFYQLISKVGKDTLYLTEKDGELLVSKVANKNLLQFRNINDEVNAYEVLIGHFDETSEVYVVDKKLSYNQVGQAVAVEKTEATAFVYDLVDNSTDIYKNFGFAGTTNVIVSLNGDEASKVTKVGPFAAVKRTGLELRAAAEDEDFALVMDTAFVDQKDNIRYAYYITKPIVTGKTAWNDEKFYMVAYTDSVAAERSNDTIKYSQDGLTRIGFVAAKRINADSLAISKIASTTADTLNVTEKTGVTNATFAFAIDENDENAYRIESSKGQYVSYLNGVLVLGGKEQAQLFNVSETDLTPTDNESIEVEGVKVIAGNGVVTIQGAAGETAYVRTVLGQMVAETILTSDNATIAAPAGVVFVTVGNETVKVVVK